MRYQSVSDQRRLLALCDELAQVPVIAFDTEFVSEHTYRPELCLVQVAAGGKLYVIDPYAVTDMTPFWERLAAPGHVSLVHAGREELRFSWRAVSTFPHSLFDIQIAAGFVGLEYPAAYSTLVSKLLQVNLSKGETRTDWRRRPLSNTQIEYALQDVLYLEDIRDILRERIGGLERAAWVDDELLRWQQELEHAETTESWRRVSGTASLGARSLAVARELWRWREAEAERQDIPARRLLRDDLIVELARRQTADLKRIRAVRGLEYRHLQRFLPTISERIEAALKLPDDMLPPRTTKPARPPLSLVGQFLNTALGSICRDAQVAPGLVGSAEDVRDLVAFRLELEAHEPPALARGWRAEVVGRKIEDLLFGRLAVRLQNPLSDQPLEFVTPGKP